MGRRKRKLPAVVAKLNDQSPVKLGFLRGELDLVQVRAIVREAVGLARTWPTGATSVRELLSTTEQQAHPAEMNPVEAARFLGLMPDTLKKWRTAKWRESGLPCGPPWVKRGRSIVYRFDDLLKFKRSREIDGDGPFTLKRLREIEGSD